VASDRYMTYHDPCHDELPNITLLAALLLLISPAQTQPLPELLVNSLLSFVTAGSGCSQKRIHKISTLVDRTCFDECGAHGAPCGQTREFLMMFLLFLFLPFLPILIVFVFVWFAYVVCDVFLLSPPSPFAATPTTIAITFVFACFSILIMVGLGESPTCLKGIVCFLAPQYFESRTDRDLCL